MEKIARRLIGIMVMVLSTSNAATLHQKERLLLVNEAAAADGGRTAGARSPDATAASVRGRIADERARTRTSAHDAVLGDRRNWHLLES